MNNQYNLYSEQLVGTSINNDSSELGDRTSLDLTNEYITSSGSNVLANYLTLPTNSDLLQQQQQQQQQQQHHQSQQQPCDETKEVVNSYLQSKNPAHIIHKGDIFSSYDLPVLTPLKYVEYQNNGVTEEQIIMTNDDICDDVTDDVSDCVQEISIKNPAKRSLPHKKRIAKKLNSDQFSLIVERAVNPQFECTECGLAIVGQLDFYIHLKEHYEGQATVKQDQRKRELDEAVEGLNMSHHEDQDVDDEEDPHSVPDNLLIETLDDSQDDIKTEDAFEFSEPEDIMEDFRKEVEKVVETIADAECMPDASWNYQVSDDIEENQSNVAMMESFPDKLESICTQQESKDCTMMEGEYTSEKFDSNSCMYTESEAGVTEENVESHKIQEEEEEEEDEDDKPLEQVRVMLKKSRRDASEKQNDKDEMELNECLKRIHNFKCNECNKAFNSRTALGYHLKTHTAERRYVCDQCGKKFLTNGALKVHLRLHTDERPYKCSQCSRSFRQFGDMKYHETSIHSDKKDHICEFCAKAFARKYSLIIHRRIHTNERNYKCTECDKSFRASSYLLNHKRIHSGEKPYSCSVCQKKFRVHGDAKRHMRIHDRVKVPKEKKNSNQNTNTSELNEGDDLKQSIIIKQEDTTSKNSIDNNNQVSKKGKKVPKRKNVK